jgi:hypothetical protein
MADFSPEQLAPIEAQFNAHPAIRAYFASPKHGALDWVRAVGQASRDLKIEIPHDYQPEQREGQVKLEKRGFLQRNPWVLPAVAVGAPLAAGAALGAFGGAAAAGGASGSAATGGGVGLGETGAVTGLAGSGFGAGGATAGGGGILGTLGKYGQQASDIGEQLSAGAQGQAEGRRADSTADMIAASQNNRALVDAAQFNRDLPMTRAQQTARGDLMSSPMQDARSTGSGRDIQFSGGVRPSSFGASTTQAGEELKRQALLKMMHPEADQLTPQITQPRQAGAGENALGIAGTGLSILGAYNKYRGGR